MRIRKPTAAIIFVLILYIAFAEFRNWQAIERIRQAEKALRGDDVREWREPGPIVEPDPASATLSEFVLLNQWSTWDNDGRLDTLIESNNNLWDAVAELQRQAVRHDNRIEELGGSQ